MPYRKYRIDKNDEIEFIYELYCINVYIRKMLHLVQFNELVIVLIKIRAPMWMNMHIHEPNSLNTWKIVYIERHNQMALTKSNRTICMLSKHYPNLSWVHTKHIRALRLGLIYICTMNISAVMFRTMFVLKMIINLVAKQQQPWCGTA